MLTKLIALGFTNDQANQAITDLGIETENDLKHLTEKDLIDLGIKLIPARRILAAAGVTPVGSGPQEITVRLDKGDVAVASMQNPEDLLAVLTAAGRSPFDKKAAAGKLAAMGRSVVVNKSARKELLTTETVAFWQRGNLRAKFWGRDENPVVSAATLFESDEKVEIDPFELVNGHRLVALDSGYNAESGADWAKVTMPRRALLIAAALDGETVARGDSVAIAETLSSETLSGKWKVLENRADVERLTELQRHLRVPLIDIDTPDSVGGRTILVAIFGHPQSEGRQSDGGWIQHQLTTVAREALIDHLCSLFKTDELRRFLRGGPHGDVVDRALPGEMASLAATADSAVAVLERYGLINRELFARLDEERPLRNRDLTRVRQLCLDF